MALAAALAAWDEPSTSIAGAHYAELANAVDTVSAFLFPRDLASGSRSSTTEAFRLVLEHGRAADVVHEFLNAVEARFFLVRQDVSRFINALQETDAVSIVPQTSSIMVDFLDRLAVWQRSWGLPLRPLGESKYISAFTSTFHRLLHAALPSSFPAHLQAFLALSLPPTTSSTSSTSSMATIAPSTRRIPPPSPHLQRLGMLPRYSAVLTAVAYGEIRRVAQEECAAGWDERCLGRARQRVSDGVVNWIAGMFDGGEYAQNVLRPMYMRFDYYLCKSVFDIRTDELFDIIVDYPESLPALEDLKECLGKVDQRGDLVDKLRASNLKRLLHPGAETKDVITQYISTIRCLRILDPPGVLLHRVAEPVRRHLRDRADTIRCIVAALVEGDELADENESMGGAGAADAEAENFTDPKWEPEPVDAAPEFRSGKASDIISTLVSIYTSRDVIVKELQALLATRLLAVKDYDAVREIRTVELLKLRFGEAALQVCDVMLKDMADSKRINDHVHGDVESTVQPLIISHRFWPTVPASRLHLPPKLQAAQTEYEAAFHHFKPDKHLRWLQALGTATVSLELADRTVEVEATPLQAAVAELFEAQAEWAPADLARALGEDDGAVRRELVWWATHGVLREDRAAGTWSLMEHAVEGADGG